MNNVAISKYINLLLVNNNCKLWTKLVVSVILSWFWLRLGGRLGLFLVIKKVGI